MHNTSVQTRLMKTLEEMPITKIVPEVKMHSKGSAENKNLTDINDSIYYIDNDVLDFIDNAELTESITNFLKVKMLNSQNRWATEQYLVMLNY